jgi:hypothetical protein
VLCSLVPTLLITYIERIDTTVSMRAAKHVVMPYISWTFATVYPVGLLLPILVSVFAVWFITSKSVTKGALVHAGVKKAISYQSVAMKVPAIQSS